MGGGLDGDDLGELLDTTLVRGGFFGRQKSLRRVLLLILYT